MSKIFTKNLVFLMLVALILLPTFAFGDPDYVTYYQDKLTDVPTIIKTILDFVWKIFFAVAVIMFVVAGIEFMTARGDPTKVSKARSFLIWGVVGIIVAVSAFSIVKIVTIALIAPPVAPPAP